MKKITYNILALLMALTSIFSVQAQSIEEGRRLTRNEQYEDAEKLFNELIAKSPKKGDPYYWAGINYLERGDSAAASEMFDKGLLMCPKYSMNYVGQAQLLLRQGKTAEAENLFQLALKTKKKLVPVVNREIGRSYLMIKDRNRSEILNNAMQAKKYLDNASTSDFEVKLLQGDASFITNPTDATEAITKYIESGYINANDPRAYLREALLYQKVKNYDISLVRIDEALAKDPDFAPAYRQKADLYTEIKKRDSAVHYYKEYLKRNNNLSARRKFVSALFYTGDFDQTIEEAKKLLKLKEFTNLYGVIAYAIVEKNDTNASVNREGLEYFETYEKKHVNAGGRSMSASEKFYKGMLLKRTGQSDAGWSLQKEALKDTMHSAQRWYDMAREEYYNTKDYKRAAECIKFKQAKNKILSSSDMYYLAISYKMDRQFVKSNEIFEQIVSIDSTYKKGYYLIAINHHLMDELDSTGKVTEAYQRWISKLTAKEKEEYRDDIIKAYEFMAYTNYVKGEKAYASAEDKANGYAKTIGLYKKYLDYSRILLGFKPDSEDLKATIKTFEEFVAKLEKRKAARR